MKDLILGIAATLAIVFGGFFIAPMVQAHFASRPPLITSGPCSAVFDQLKADHHGRLPRHMSAHAYIGELYASALETHGFRPTATRKATITRQMLLQGTADLLGCFNL